MRREDSKNIVSSANEGCNSSSFLQGLNKKWQHTGFFSSFWPPCMIQHVINSFFIYSNNQELYESKAKLQFKTEPGIFGFWFGISVLTHKMTRSLSSLLKRADNRSKVVNTCIHVLCTGAIIIFSGCSPWFGTAVRAKIRVSICVQLSSDDSKKMRRLDVYLSF